MKATIFIISTLMFLWHCPEISATEHTDRKPSFTREGPESCLRCHSGEKMRAMAASPHGNADIEGTPAALHGCESCHGKGSIHISRAHGGKGFPLLTQFGKGRSGSPRDEKLDGCLACHADESMGEKRTIFLGSLHDRRTINCSTCHVAHAESDPMHDMAKQNKICSRCHRKDIREHQVVEGETITTENRPCADCHDVHVPADASEEPEE